MTDYIDDDIVARGIGGTIGQLVWLPCMIVKDLFQKPTSRKLGERLTTGVTYNMQTVARYALAKGAFPNTKDSSFTMLIRAAGAGKKSVVRMLLKAGADPNLIGPQGHTPLVSAITEGRSGAAILLLKAGANAELPNSDGVTPLMAAAMGGHPSVVAALLKAGVDVLKHCPGSGTTAGGTPLDIARRKDYHDVVALLEPAVQAALAAQSGAAPAAMPAPAAGGFNPAAASIPVMEPIKLKSGVAPASSATP
jgi:ankyrin repeat protein